MYWPINVQIVNLVYAVTLGSMSQLCHMLDAKLMISPSQLHVAHCHPTMLILLHAPSHSAPCPIFFDLILRPHGRGKVIFPPLGMRLLSNSLW